MNEHRLLTDRQIARRKIIAIGLIGLGVVLLPPVWAIFREWIVPIYREELGWEYADRSLHIGGIVYAVLAGLTAAAGWYSVRKLLDKSKSNFVKHWIMAYLLRLCYVVGLSLVVFPFTIATIVSWLLFLLISVYMIWALDSARKNSFDPAVRKAVVFVQAVLAMRIIVGSLIGGYVIIINHVRGVDMVQAGDLIVYYLSWILPIVLFFGMVKLIRSSLFASTSEQLETFAEQSAPRTPFFSAPVCGAIGSAIFCVGLTVVLTLFWNDIYNAF